MGKKLCGGVFEFYIQYIKLTLDKFKKCLQGNVYLYYVGVTAGEVLNVQNIQHNGGIRFIKVNVLS